jgi:hypothetical protein
MQGGRRGAYIIKVCESTRNLNVYRHFLRVFAGSRGPKRRPVVAMGKNAVSLFVMA